MKKLMLITASLITLSASPAQAITDNEAGAIVLCKELVKEFLKLPGSAKFPWVPEDIQTNGNQYTVKSYVDSQNGFGAQLRTKYTCAVKNEHGEWSLVDFKLR